MSDTEQVSARPGETLQRYVLAPIAVAESVLDQEYEELDAERRTFEEFRRRVVTIETVSGTSTASGTRAPLLENRSSAVERVRSAYRETVMDVDHYDDVYGESLVEHAAAELSVEIAAGLQRVPHVQFTRLYKRALLTAVDDAVDQRETFGAILDGERESLTQCRGALFVLLEGLDGTRVPAGVGPDFRDSLDDIARQRQETFTSRTASPRTDGHDLCNYLYADQCWTYPVLTAVTRLRGTVDCPAT